MNVLKNQKGMALVTVLLVIIIFTILGTVLLNLTISNAKQVNKTEEDIQAVDIAEMGIVYYENQFIYQANEMLKTKIQNAINQIHAINDLNRNTKNYVPIAINTPNIMARLNLKKEDFIQNASINKLVDNQSTKGYDVLISSPNSTISDKLTIEFVSNGKIPGKTATILGSFVLDISDIIDAYFGSVDTISNLLGLNGICTSAEISADQCPEVKDVVDLYVNQNGEYFFGTSNGGIKNEVIYIANDAKFGSTNGGIKWSTIIIGGSAEFGSINGGIKHGSKVYVSGDAKFDRVTGGGVDNSSLVCVGGSTNLIDNNVYSGGANSGNYQNKCVGNQNTDPSNILPVIVDQVNDHDLEYK